MAETSKLEASPIGQRLRAIRKESGWTLAELSKRTAISVGTLSKVENGKTALNFTSVNKLAEGLNLPVTDLTSPTPESRGARAITVGGSGVVFRGSDIDYEVLCSDVANQQQCFMKAVIRARGEPADRDWHRHTGQEFIYVLKGQLKLFTELYEPIVLKVGDSILFDSSMGHHYGSCGRTAAELLISFSLKGYEDSGDVILAQNRKKHSAL